MKANKSSGHFNGSEKSDSWTFNRGRCRWIKNFHGLFATCYNVFEFSLNPSGTLTFENENLENDFIKNFDEIIDERFSTCRMKGFQSALIEWSTKSEYCYFLEWIRNNFAWFEILPVSWSGFRRLVITWIDRRIYWRSRADFT